MQAHITSKPITKELQTFFSCATFRSLGGNRVDYTNWVQFCKKAGFISKTLSIAKCLRQGLTLVHFSAQPEPFLSQHTP
jgi:hypothetical protein